MDVVEPEITCLNCCSVGLPVPSVATISNCSSLYVKPCKFQWFKALIRLNSCGAGRFSKAVCLLEDTPVRF